MKAPFPWFGGKSRVAHLVWDRFGDVPNYVEPFAGSLAVLLRRPHAARIETVNDSDCFLANFWRSLKNAPSETAQWADWPINEADLHARHLWLTTREEFKQRMMSDPDYFDPKIAGWWVWGICQWIGSGWCEKPEWKGRTNAGRFKGDVGGIAVSQQIPNLSGDSGAAGRGIHGSGVTEPIEAWFHSLRDRLRHVRVCCGDWKRVIGPSPTVKIGVTGVFLDPPYDMRIVSNKDSGRDGHAPTDKLYNNHSNDVSREVREWAIENGSNPDLRIALCGYDGEHEMPEAWTCVGWKANGGYGNQRGDTNGKVNAHRERIWFSPHCLRIGLFEEIA